MSAFGGKADIAQPSLIDSRFMSTRPARDGLRQDQPGAGLCTEVRDSALLRVASTTKTKRAVVRRKPPPRKPPLGIILYCERAARTVESRACGHPLVHS